MTNVASDNTLPSDAAGGFGYSVAPGLRCPSCQHELSVADVHTITFRRLYPAAKWPSGVVLRIENHQYHGVAMICSACDATVWIVER